VLIANGEDGACAELFNPKTNSFVRTINDMSMVHDTATLLANGQVLLAGRTGLPNGNPGDLYNPTADTFSTTLGRMEFATSATTATLLENGQVLFTGGNAFRLQSKNIALRSKVRDFQFRCLGSDRPPGGAHRHSATKRQSADRRWLEPIVQSY
jgi:hypothetical protein